MGVASCKKDSQKHSYAPARFNVPWPTFAANAPSAALTIAMKRNLNESSIEWIEEVNQHHDKSNIEARYIEELPMPSENRMGLPFFGVTNIQKCLLL